MHLTFKTKTLDPSPDILSLVCRGVASIFILFVYSFPVHHICHSLCEAHTTTNLLLINHMNIEESSGVGNKSVVEKESIGMEKGSVGVEKKSTGVEKDVLQRPVEISQTVTIPLEVLERAIPSSTCRLTDTSEARAGSVDSESVEAPICQNLIDLSLDNEMREDENAREVISLA